MRGREGQTERANEERSSERVSGGADVFMTAIQNDLWVTWMEAKLRVLTSCAVSTSSSDGYKQPHSTCSYRL